MSSAIVSSMAAASILPDVSELIVFAIESKYAISASGIDFLTMSYCTDPVNTPIRFPLNSAKFPSDIFPSSRTTATQFTLKITSENLTLSSVSGVTYRFESAISIAPLLSAINMLPNP